MNATRSIRKFRRLRSRSRRARVFLRPADELGARTRAFASSSSQAARIRGFRRLFRLVWRAAGERGFLSQILRWIRLLEHDAVLRAEFQTSLAAMLGEMDFVSIFSETGLPTRQAVFSEGLRRVVQRFLPASRPANDASRLLGSLFASRRDAARFLSLPDPLFGRLRRLLVPAAAHLDEDGLADANGLPKADGLAAQAAPLGRDLRQSLRLLAARIAGRGMSPGLRARGSGSDVKDSPFYRLIFLTDELADAHVPAAHLAAWRDCAARCRREIDRVHRHMESSGVSSGVMLDLRSIEMGLARMNRLAALLAPGTVSPAAARRLIGELIQGRLEDRRLSSLLRQDLNLLARKTVEHTARSGEHYIAHNHREYWGMWLAAFGGGLLTVLTAAGKMYVMEGHYPLFVEGFLNSIDYSISFILLQVFGLALATKQPSATAASFAVIVRGNRGQARWRKISEFTARITRTQLAAAIANVIAVSAGAVAFEWLWRTLFSRSYLPAAAARHVYQTLHPFNSGTVFFAIETGILLWLAALIGGWCENFAAYHNVTAAVAQHPLGDRFGERSMARAANWLEYNLAGWSTSIALGFLLGFAPDIAGFFGIPFQVRHVTLTTGTLALAVAHFGAGSVEKTWFYYAAAGIGVTFVLNLGVSFCTAAYVALRAYDVPAREQFQIVRYLLRQAMRSPWRFVLPIDNGGRGAKSEVQKPKESKGPEMRDPEDA